MQNETIKGFRLSPQQKRLWSLQKDSVAYQSQCALLIEGKLNLELLKEALQQVVNRHEILRTTFQQRPGIKIPIQVISASSNISFVSFNLSDLHTQEQTATINRIFQENKNSNFNFEQEKLIHLSLLKLSLEQHILIVSLPSLCADSWSIKNLVQEISHAYKACLIEEELSDELIQYIQYSEWQNELLEEEDAETGRNYWQQQNLPTLILPFESQYSARTEFAPEVYTLRISPEIVTKIEAIATLHNATITEFLFACWQTLFWRLTGQSDIVISTIFNGRKYEELHSSLGLLAKWLPVRCPFQDNFIFTEILAQIGETLFNHHKWQEYFIWEEAVEFPISFEFEDWAAKYSAGEVSFAVVKQYVCFEPFKIKLSCVRTQESLTAEFHYDSKIIDIESIKCLAEQFQTLVESAVNNPAAKVSELKILSDRDRQQLLVDFNNTQTNYPQIECIHHLFEQQVERTPDNIAVVFEDQQLTYTELNARANQIAHYLQQQGVGPEVLVGIYVERSLDIVTVLLGVLKAGGAYLPLDPALPAENLVFRLQDAQSAVLITQKGLFKSQDTQVPIVILDTDWEAIAQESQKNPTSQLTTENLAYALYTSGSTGKPKAVAIEHRQILNYLHAILDKLQLTAPANFAIVSTFAADLGNTAIFPALCTGGCLHILSQRASDPKALADYFHRHPIDCLKIVPSHLAALLESVSILPQQCLVLGGEAVSWDLIEKIQQQSPNCRIINHYGPTETTVGVLTYPVKSKQDSYNSKTVPIGRAIANIQVYILDSQLQPVPTGVPGELYIGGAGLARGYLHHSELTAEKFITNPFLDGGRLYRTGDLARYLPDGNIEFIGRLDNQEKIRGFRIEPGEIEVALLQHPNVLHSVVIAYEDCPGNKRLGAYIVPKNKQVLSTKTLRDFLKEKLPDYMIPSAFTILKTLPLTPNGKVDRRALPAPDRARPEQEKGFVAPRNSTEEILAVIWAEVLGVQQVGIYDNFFDLGGHSLQAIQLVSKIAVAINLDFSVRLLFSHPMIADLADALADLQKQQEFPKEVTSTSKKLTIQKASPFLQLERRSLLSLFATGKIAPVDAVALGYLNINISELEKKGISRDDIIHNWCDNLPLITSVIETPWAYCRFNATSI